MIATLTDSTKKKAVDRLEFAGLNQTKELTEPSSQFFKNPVKYALYRFSYFPCYKCHVSDRNFGITLNRNPILVEKEVKCSETTLIVVACEAARADDFDPKGWS